MKVLSNLSSDNTNVQIQNLDNVPDGNTRKLSNYSPTSHTHSKIMTEGDNRGVATTPNDYQNSFQYRGLKTNTVIGSPSTDTYSYVLGLRGWSDKSGGNTWEMAFNNSGINVRNGADTWNSWQKILTSGNYNNYVDTTLSSTSTNPVQNKVINSALAGKANSTHTHTKSQITDFPTLATVATSGNYNDLSNKPSIPTPITYSAGTGLSLSGTTFSVNNSTISPYEEKLQWGGGNWASNVSPIGMALSNEHNANRLALINPNALYFEYSSDNGATWTNYGLSDTNKTAFCTTSATVYVGSNTSSTTRTTSMKTRITLTAQTGTAGYVYTAPKKMLINVSTACGLSCLVEYKTGVSGAAWQTFGTYAVSGWSGWNDIPLILGTLGGGTTQTSNIWQLRLTFSITSIHATSPAHSSLLGMRIFGNTDWTSASASRSLGPLSSTGHLYSYDMSANATFPAQITATQFNGQLNGNATSATTASNASKVNNHTVEADVPSNARFTDYNQTISANGTIFGNDAAVNLVAGSNITLTPNTSNNSVTIASSGSSVNLINNLTTTSAGQGALDAYQGYQLKQTVQNIADAEALLEQKFLAIYPVGSIYLSVNNVNPSTFIGGTWTLIKDKFLLGAGDTYTAGSTGGEATHTLTVAEMPSHTHTGPSHTHTGPSHTHTTPNHTHTMQNGGSHSHRVQYAANMASGGYHGPNSSGGLYKAASTWIEAAGAHAHTVNSSGGGTSGAAGTGNTGASGTGATGSAGSGSAHNNMPPYLVVYMWQRTA